ncbi:MAG TPA: hypothetical protein PLM79_17625 [Syntrophobacteraceae bacterium]|nr:hypothetical protein [Syntrophobacteraceae bacterium]
MSLNETRNSEGRTPMSMIFTAKFRSRQPEMHSTEIAKEKVTAVKALKTGDTFELESKTAGIE